LPVVDLAVVSQIFACLVCCSVLQCVAVCCSVLQCVAVCCSMLQYVAVCCSVLQCAAVLAVVSQISACLVCCSVLQCVASIAQLYLSSLSIQCAAVCWHQGELTWEMYNFLNESACSWNSLIGQNVGSLMANEGANILADKAISGACWFLKSVYYQIFNSKCISIQRYIFTYFYKCTSKCISCFWKLVFIIHLLSYI